MKPIDKLSEDEWSALVRETVRMQGAPAPWLRSALELWRDHAPAALHAGVRRWIAALTLDSWRAVPYEAGVRAVPSDVRCLQFAAAGRDIDVRITPLAEGYCISGQYVGADDEAGASRDAPADAQGVWSRIGDEQAAAGLEQIVAMEPTGEFRIEGVEPGTYMLRLRLGDDEIVLPAIEVGWHPGQEDP